MPTNIFSTYSTGENRVTASIMAVLRSLSLDRIERLLAALLEESEFELVKFANQPSKGSEGVPDAVISSSCHLLVETKVQKNAVKPMQLERHLKRLQKARESRKALLVLTPDEQRPKAFEQFDSQLLAWASFGKFDQAINELLADPQEVVSEREAFLLRELQSLFVREKLIASDSDVVVVAARDAWPEYQKYCAYVCQPDRPFQLVRHIAFYTAGRILPVVPRIREVQEHVEFSPGVQPAKLDRLIRTLLAETPRQEGHAYKVMWLSEPDASETVRLPGDIVNNLTTAKGRTWAFTLSQRYVALDRLLKARTTKELVDD